MSQVKFHVRYTTKAIFVLNKTLKKQTILYKTWRESSNEIFIINIERSEIIDDIKILNPKKASGPDILSHKMLNINPFTNNI